MNGHVTVFQPDNSGKWLQERGLDDLGIEFAHIRIPTDMTDEAGASGHPSASNCKADVPSRGSLLVHDLGLSTVDATVVSAA